jgi:DHA2 family multidrug resistance protein
VPSGQHKAIVAIGGIVKRQALIQGFGDTFAVIGVSLALAAVILFLAKGPPKAKSREVAVAD